VKRIVVAAVTAACCLVVVAPAHAVRDFSSTALNIIPSGQYGAVPVPKKASGQAKMYDALTPLFDDVTKADLLRNFKSEKLGTKGQGRIRRERVPRRGVRIMRDKFNVPHIYGRTNDDVTWGAGWALAHDRELLLEQARYNARVAVVDAPGLSAIGLIVGLKSFQPSAQTERELRKEIGKLRKYGKPGRRLLHDMAVYVKGINAYYKANKRPHKPWTILDVIALNAIKSELFGEGGGGEVDAAQMLDGLQDTLGADRGLSVWNDLRQRQDPETPVSIPGKLPVRARTGEPQRQRRARQRLVPGRAGAGGSGFGCRAGRDAPSGEQRADGGGQALEVPTPAVRRRAADRLLLSRPDARDGPSRSGLERARRDLGPVPRVHPDRPARGLRVDAHVSRRRHRGHLRRDALRRRRHEVPLQGPVPRHDGIQRGHARQPAGAVQPDCARSGRRLRNR
jgi:hypothetical protein